MSNLIKYNPSLSEAENGRILAEQVSELENKFSLAQIEFRDAAIISTEFDIQNFEEAHAAWDAAYEDLRDAREEEHDFLNGVAGRFADGYESGNVRDGHADYLGECEREAS